MNRVKKIVRDAGGSAVVAARLRVSPVTVWRWITQGYVGSAGALVRLADLIAGDDDAAWRRACNALAKLKL